MIDNCRQAFYLNHMKIILAGYNLDSEVIEELKKNSPERQDITPETISAAYARISRDPRPVDELRAVARAEVERARRSNQNIIFKTHTDRFLWNIDSWLYRQYHAGLECLKPAQAVVDISGRPYLVHDGEPDGFALHLIAGHFTGSLVRHTFEAISYHAGLTVHLRVLAGRDPHHIAEAEYKAFARAFRQAKALDPLVRGIPSTKGAL